MTARLFLAFLALMAFLVFAIAGRYLSGRARSVVIVGLPIWLIYVGCLSYLGVIRNPALRPPGALYIFLPVFLFVFLFLVRSSSAARIAAALPITLLMGLQSFRIGIELFLHQLWLEGRVPRLMTYEGGNIDILIGATAPIIAWVVTRGTLGRKVAIGWSIVGLLSLAKIIVRSVLTSPGPFHRMHAEVLNTAIGNFPYTFIAGFFAPLAIVLHVLATRALLQSKISA